MYSEHYPYFEVDESRLHRAISEVEEWIGFDVTWRKSSHRDRRIVFLGAGCLGYKDCTTGKYYLHPMWMEAEEKVGFEPGHEFDYLKESFSTGWGAMKHEDL